LFSSIYIIGTGLSITVVMALSIVFYIKIANIYPETNRDRLLVVVRAVEKKKDGKGRILAYLSPKTVETCFTSLKSAEAVSIESINYDKNFFIQTDGTEEQLPVSLKYVDENFWTVFTFRFINGKPFTQADVQSGIRTAVISESLARRLFGTTEATGRTLSLNFNTFQVCGVVRDVSFLTEQTFAQLWLPYPLNPHYQLTFTGDQTVGQLRVYILAPSTDKINAVKQETADNIDRYNRTLKDVEFSIFGQPDTHWQSVIRSGKSEVNIHQIVLRYVLILLILLLIPAVCLSGMTHSRMERRIAETGVRRTFGATVANLMTQIITENLLFTLLGGIVGLLSSYAVILLGRGWITRVIGQASSLPDNVDIVFSPSMLLNMPVFTIALLICFLLNLLSSLIPAWQHSHREIVHSLNAKL
ncbi:MAG: ABC transporter permease, partial [Tannerella sp.]|nr:ABC transporter permease [Tannerella sp.]